MMITKRIRPAEYERVLSLVDIKDVIGRITDVKRAGSYYRACCPFHNEKTPSFVIYGKDAVSHKPNSFHCFGGECQEHGNLFDFVKKYYNLTPHESLEWIAKEFNITLEYERVEPTIEELRKDYLSKLISSIAGALNANLISQPDSSDIKRYVRSRNLSDEDIKKWKIGFGNQKFVREQFLGKNFMGSVIDYNDFRDIDVDSEHFFNNRIAFPIFDLYGSVVGFSNRVFAYNENKEIQKQTLSQMEANYGKYINTTCRTVAYNEVKGSILFEQKASFLYGLNFARQFLRKSKGVLILVEGLLDVIACHRHGIFNVAGLMGTAFNDESVSLLKKCNVRKVVFCLDGDKGGKGGTEQILKNVQKGNLEVDFEISIAALPEDPRIKDPDGYLSVGSPEGFLSAMGETKCISEFFIDKEIQGKDFTSLSDKMKFINSVKEDLNTSRNLSELEKKITVDSLSEKLDVPKKVVKEFLGYKEKGLPGQIFNEISEKVVIAELISNEESRAEILSSVDYSDYYYSRNQMLHKMVYDLNRSQQPVDFNIIRVKGQEDGVEGKYYDAAYIDELNLVVRANVHFHSNKIVEYSKRRKLLQFGEKIGDSIFESEDLGSVIGDVSKDLYKLSFNKGADTFKSPIEEAKEYSQAIENRFSNPGIQHGILTGYAQFDDATQGLFPGQTMLILARTSDGKTALAQNMVCNMSLRAEPAIPTYYANLEMPAQQMMDRMMSIYTGIPARNISSGYMNDEKKHLLRMAIANYGLRNSLFIQATTELTVESLASILRYQIERNHIKLAVVDYVGLMTVVKEFSKLTSSDQMGVISRGVTGLAKMLMIPIIIIAQANRDTVTNNQGRPELQHVFGSDKFAHDVDIAVSLQPKTLKQQNDEGFLTPEEMIEKGYQIRNEHGVIDKDIYEKLKVSKNGNYWLHILKNRKGQKDSRISFFFHRHRLTFEEVKRI